MVLQAAAVLGNTVCEAPSNRAPCKYEADGTQHGVMYVLAGYAATHQVPTSKLPQHMPIQQQSLSTGESIQERVHPAWHG